MEDRSPTLALDVEFSRSHFPALNTEWAFLDNAGGSVPCQFVIQRVCDYMSSRMVQHGGSYAPSRAAAGAVRCGHAAAATLIGADEDEVVLGHSTTQNAQLLARALRSYIGKDGVVIVSNADHEANLCPWLALERDGVEIREWKLDQASCCLRVEDLEPLLDSRVKLVCFPHVSNLIGAVHDVQEITRRVHAVGARVVVDGVAYAPHRLVDVHAWDVDFYFCSLYKVYGPHVGCMYGKRQWLLDAEGQYNRCVAETNIPYKLEPGNPTHELVAAIPGILEYLEAMYEHHCRASEPRGANNGETARSRLSRVFELISEYELFLMTPLLDFLSSHPRVHIIGPATQRIGERMPTISFTVSDMKASAIPLALDKSHVAIRWGTFHAIAPASELGLCEKGKEGAVRVSLVHYNTPKEVERLIVGLKSLLDGN